MNYYNFTISPDTIATVTKAFEIIAEACDYEVIDIANHISTIVATFAIATEKDQGVSKKLTVDTIAKNAMIIIKQIEEERLK